MQPVVSNPYVAPSLAALFKHRDPPKQAADCKKESEQAAPAAPPAAGAGALAPVVAAMQRLTLAPALDTLPEQLASIADTLITYDPTLELLGSYLDHLQMHLQLPAGQDVRVLLFKNNSQLVQRLLKSKASYRDLCDFTKLPPKIQAAFLVPGVGSNVAAIELQEDTIYGLAQFCEVFSGLRKLSIQNSGEFQPLQYLQELIELGVYAITDRSEFPRLNALKALTLKSCENFVETAAILRKQCPALTALDIARADFGAANPPKANPPEDCTLPTVRHLTLGRSDSGRSPNLTGVKIAHFFPELTHLTLERMDEIEGFELLSKVTSLRAVGSAETLQKVVAKNPQIERLHFERPQETFSKILEAIAPLQALTHLTLDFQHYSLTEEGIKTLRKNHPKLQEVTIHMAAVFIDREANVMAARQALNGVPSVKVHSPYPARDDIRKKLEAALPHVRFTEKQLVAPLQKSADDHYKALHPQGPNPLTKLLEGASCLHDLVMRTGDRHYPLPPFLLSAISGAGATLRALQFDREDFLEDRFDAVAALVPEVRDLRANCAVVKVEKRMQQIVRCFPKLERLEIANLLDCQYSLTEDLGALSGLPQLRAVAFSGLYTVTAAPIASLVKAKPALASLTIASHIYESVMKEIAGFQGLTELSIHPVSYSKDVTPFFTIIGAHLTTLERLSITCTLTKELALLLAPLQSLIALEGVTITDPEVLALLKKQHPKLAQLALTNKPSSAVVAALSNLTQLKALKLPDFERLAELATACPQLEELHCQPQPGSQSMRLTTTEATPLLQLRALKRVGYIRIEEDWSYRVPEQERPAFEKAARMARLQLITKLEEQGCRIYADSKSE